MSTDKNTSNIVDFPVLEPSELIIADGNTLTTTSVCVAEVFGKQHKNVLAKVEALDCSEEFNRLNFKPVEYLDSKGEKRPAYEMTKDGFMFVVMGFTGKKAAQIKEAYINAFNWMADKLLGNNSKLTPDQQRDIQEAVTAKLEHLDPKERKAHYQKIYGRIKNKFRVGTYKDILSIHFQEAIDYIDQIKLDVPAIEQKTEGLELSVTDAQHVYLLVFRLNLLRKKMNDIHTAATLLNSSVLMDIFSQLHEAGSSIFFLNKKYEEAEDIYKKLTV